MRMCMCVCMSEQSELKSLPKILKIRLFTGWIFVMDVLLFPLETHAGTEV